MTYTTYQNIPQPSELESKNSWLEVNELKKFVPVRSREGTFVEGADLKFVSREMTRIENRGEARRSSVELLHLPSTSPMINHHEFLRQSNQRSIKSSRFFSVTKSILIPICFIKLSVDS